MNIDHGIVCRDKTDGSTTVCSRGEAIVNLSGYYGDAALALDGATEDHPAQTAFTLYWPRVVAVSQ